MMFNKCQIRSRCLVAPVWLAMSVLAPIGMLSKVFGNDGPPNIVIILADDLGWADVGFHGSDIHTPHIDALAKSGVKLERFYAMPFCTPTRAALLTGRYPFRYGLQTAAIPSDGSYGLDVKEILLPNILRRNGYSTAIVGKWHLGHADKKYWPNNRGFDYQYGPLVGEIDYYTHAANGKRDWYENGEPLTEEGYATELIGAKAVEKIKKHDKTKPLFLYLTFTSPHAPYQAPENQKADYPNIKDPTRRSYAAMVSVMDQQIGKVLKALEQKEMIDDSIILFMSDNGGNRLAAMSGESDVSDMKLPASNAPYSGGKGTVREGGCRVVGVINWPKNLNARTYNQPIHVVDWMPTFLSAAGIEHEFGKRKIDGLNLWNSIATSEEPHRQEVIYNIEPYRAAVSDLHWKLILRPAIPPKAELYDLSKDPGEENNLADSHPDIVKRLRIRIFELAEKSETPLFLKYLSRNSDKTMAFVDSMLNGKSARGKKKKDN